MEQNYILKEREKVHSGVIDWFQESGWMNANLNEMLYCLLS